MRDRDLAAHEVARLFGVNKATVYGWRRGDRPPSRAVAAHIEAVTKGVVKAGSWD